MKKSILILSLLLIEGIPSIAQNFENRLYPLSENGKRYYVNIWGERVTESIYDDEYADSDDNESGRIKVRKNGLYGIIDIQGRELVPCLYQNLTEIYYDEIYYETYYDKKNSRKKRRDDYFRCEKDGKYGIIKDNGIVVISCIYDWIYPELYENKVVSCQKNGKWGTINVCTGRTVIPFEYDRCRGIGNCLFVCKGDHMGCLNTEGGIILPFIYSSRCYYEPYDDEYAVLQNSKTGIWYSYNYKENKVVEIGRYDDLAYSYCKRIRVKKEGKYGFVNSENGKLVIPCIYDDASMFFLDNRAYVLQKSHGDGYALISNSGTLLTDFIFASITYRSGYASITNQSIINEKYGCVDMLGNIIIPYEYDYLSDFNKDGYAVFGNNEKYGVINKVNNTIIPAVYDRIWIGSNFFHVKKGDKYGYINYNNHTIVPFSKDDSSLKMDQYLYSQMPSDVDENIPLSRTMSNATFAIIISNEKYLDEGVPSVSYSISDGKSFKEYCSRTLGVPIKNIKFITDATLNQMRSGINWACDNAKVWDGEATVIVYYSGHGIPNEKTGNAYLLPSDGDVNDYRSAMGTDDLYEQLGELKTKRTMVFLDACFSGTSKDGKYMLADSRGITIKSKLTQPKGNMIVLSAAQGDETAYSYRKKKHGMFTYFLLRKLQETNGDVSLGELSQYINKQVRQQSMAEMGKIQTPSVNVSSLMGADWMNIKLK